MFDNNQNEIIKYDQELHVKIKELQDKQKSISGLADEVDSNKFYYKESLEKIESVLFVIYRLFD